MPYKNYPKRQTSSRIVDRATPKQSILNKPVRFNLAYIHDKYFFSDNCDPQYKLDFVNKLQKFHKMNWGQVFMADKHKMGKELLPKNSISLSPPKGFETIEEYMVLRYSGLLPMVGYKDEDVFCIFWLEDGFNKLYDHD